MNKILFAILLVLVACSPALNPTPTPRVITIYASPITQPWLTDAYNCAREYQLILSNVNDPAQAEIAIRLGEPDTLKSLAFQIDRDDILIVTHSESPLQNMSLGQVQALFSNSGALAQIWVFPPTQDIQQIFTREGMQNTAITSQARLATSPQQMSDALNSDKNSIGILPRRWKTGTAREIFSLADVPVLALTKSEPQGALKELLGCLQKY